jgi:hypothetical protein
MAGAHRETIRCRLRRGSDPPLPPQVFDNVVVQPRDAREASDVFYRQRIGDILLTYENEVVLTNQVRRTTLRKAADWCPL